MAKNAGRKANIEAKKQSQLEAKNQEKVQKRLNEEQQAELSGKKKDILYQVKTLRDDAVIKAYITFTYRVMHPGVTGRLIFIGILIALPSIIAKALWLKILCLAVGGLLILLGFFRQYISLVITKSKDPAYINKTEFTYNFYQNDATFYADDRMFSTLSKYKDITAFYYDDDFYYLGIRNKDFFIMPKSRFTIGDPAQFEEFIYKRSRKTCRWIPNKMSDRIRQRRAYRRMQADEIEKSSK